MPTNEVPSPSNPNDEHGEPAGGLTRRQVVRGINAGLLVLSAPGIFSEPSLAETASNTGPRMGPHKVRAIENVWIAMQDGTKLAARMWLPDDAEQSAAPALLEYHPYRKRDWTRLNDESNYSFLASHGYACVRADIRGTGDSEGVPHDEYVKQEQDDGVAIIAWIASQPWCNGKVGMLGNSWAGFNSLQVAARRPPALKAIVTQCSTDDRYTDDEHYTGGCINEGMFGWGGDWTSRSALPPDPAIVGSRWREMWRARLEGLEFFVGNWFAHQHRDAFWKHGSVDENYSAIQCPVYIVGGWVDPYTNAVARLLTGLTVPRKALIGPWGHGHLHAQSFPLHGRPGPGIDWLSESLRWWDYWLKGIDTGIMREPLLRVWMPDESAFQHMENVPGRWVAEDVWPSPRIRLSRFYLNDRRLEVQPRPETVQTLSPRQTVGVTAPVYFAYSPMDFPADQRVDDARSLTFDSAPLDTAMEILGTAIAHLDLSVDQPVAFLIARLDELTVDGVSRRVTYQVLNLCHRESHEAPTPLEPGRRYRVRLPFRDIAHVFKRGSRVRVSISSTSWPMIWPSPQAVNLKLYTGGSMLELPVRPPRAEDATLRPFGPAVAIPNSGSIDLVHQEPEHRAYEWNVATGTLTIRTIQDYSRSRLIATGTEMSSSHRLVQEIRDDVPTSARLERSEMLALYRPGWDVRVETMLSLSVTEHAFMLTGQVKAFDHGNLFFSRKWEPQITRNLV